MSGQPLEQAIARLRLLLVEIRQKETDLQRQVEQFRAQLERAPAQALYSPLPLETLLMVMGEVQERLGHAQMTLQHLRAVKERVRRELQALELTQRVQQARAELQTLRERAQREADEGLLEEIRRLEALISEYSQRAARTITRPEEGEGAPSTG